MHVLLLKEPRDGESGPDPYIRVSTPHFSPLVCLFTALAVMFTSAQTYTFHALHFAEMLKTRYFDLTGAGITWA